MKSLFILSFLITFKSIESFYFSVSPPNNAFLLQSPTTSTNASNKILYLQGDCALSTEQLITVSSGSRVENQRLYSSIPNLHCAVSVKLVNDVVKLDRPYVDVLALADVGLLSHLKQSACVTVQVTSSTGDTVSSTCHLFAFDESRHNCLLRIPMPFSWFGKVGSNSPKKTLSRSHTVSTTCNVPFYERPQTVIHLMPYIEIAQSHTLANNNECWHGYLFSLLLKMKTTTVGDIKNSEKVVDPIEAVLHWEIRKTKDNTTNYILINQSSYSTLFVLIMIFRATTIHFLRQFINLTENLSIWIDLANPGLPSFGY